MSGRECVDVDPSHVKDALIKTKYGDRKGEANIEELLSRCDALLQFDEDTDIANFRVIAIGKILELCRHAGSGAVDKLRSHRELLRRLSAFGATPIVVFVDEAHNFLGQDLGRDETAARLDAFEIVAREGRKYGLNLCLATQRPRDLTEGVLSQVGTLIVHRLTNDRDRDVVERACGEIDHSASAFLPNLEPGEAAIIGVDFPIPLTIQIEPPKTPPVSDGPNYQNAWYYGEAARAKKAGIESNLTVAGGR